jgi:V/A-type H+-transporting ATPase subunit E
MQSKLQELTEKIYQEGVNKGTQEADQIVAKAKADAQQILNDAQKEAEQLLIKTKKEAVEFKKNSESEIQLTGKQMLNAFKQQLVHIITAKVVNPAVGSAVNDAEFVKQIVNTAISTWNPSNATKVELELLLPKELEKKLASYFTDAAGKQLNQGVNVLFEDNFNAGFKIGPKDGGYYISFTDADFENLFKEYLRPRLIELLFGEE